MYDVIIIGGGPTGINCGIAASKAGLNYLILEKGVITNSIFNFPTNMTFFSTSKLLEIGDIPFISHTDKPTRKEALEYYRRLVQSYQLNISMYESVESMVAYEEGYKIISSKSEYHTKSVIVCTGFYDNVNPLHVPGEDLPKVRHYYDEAHHYIGQNIAVIGAANSACDVALETWQKGANVTMVVRKPHLYPRVKYWILPNIENRIKEGSITAHFETNIIEIKPSSIVLKNEEDGIFEIKNDFVLAMTGYRPDYPLLKQLGIDINSDIYQTPTYDESTLETNLPNVYLAGVVNGGLKTNAFFIENTRHQGELIMDQIRSSKKR